LHPPDDVVVHTGPSGHRELLSRDPCSVLFEDHAVAVSAHDATPNDYAVVHHVWGLISRLLRERYGATDPRFRAWLGRREMSARASHGGEGRIRAARFPSRKSLEVFDYDHTQGLNRDTIAHLGMLDFITLRENVVTDREAVARWVLPVPGEEGPSPSPPRPAGARCVLVVPDAGLSAVSSASLRIHLDTDVFTGSLTSRRGQLGLTYSVVVPLTRLPQLTLWTSVHQTPPGKTASSHGAHPTATASIRAAGRIIW
jgi:hypothetical protein